MLSPPLRTACSLFGASEAAYSPIDSATARCAYVSSPQSAIVRRLSWAASGATVTLGVTAVSVVSHQNSAPPSTTTTTIAMRAAFFDTRRGFHTGEVPFRTRSWRRVARLQQDGR